MCSFVVLLSSPLLLLLICLSVCLSVCRPLLSVCLSVSNVLEINILLAACQHLMQAAAVPARPSNKPSSGTRICFFYSVVVVQFFLLRDARSLAKSGGLKKERKKMKTKRSRGGKQAQPAQHSTEQSEALRLIIFHLVIRSATHLYICCMQLASCSHETCLLPRLSLASSLPPQTNLLCQLYSQQSRELGQDRAEFVQRQPASCYISIKLQL